MKKKIQYTDEPPDVDLAGAIRVRDFIPPAAKLVFRKEHVVTLRLDDMTLAEIKKIAGKKGLGVSTLIRMWVKERIGSPHGLA
jgi:predicted DNA binding CopG/RHH family protein